VNGAPRRPDLDRDSLTPLPIDVVSVQSQVVYGSVGNSVAVPTLQALGIGVAAVPTVLLSNVPHYATLHGGPVPTEWFAGYLGDLERRRVLERARVVLVGYLGPPEQTAVLVEWLQRVLVEHPHLRLVLDPVMGDRDVGVYVHPDLPGVLRDDLVPMAHGIAPNAFEFEQVVGRPVPTYAETVAAARELLQTNLEWVVVTSAAPAETPAGRVRVAVVTRDEDHLLEHEHVATAAKGTGDLFAAVLVGALLRGYSVKGAASVAARRTVAVLRRTAELGCGELVLG